MSFFASVGGSPRISVRRLTTILVLIVLTLTLTSCGGGSATSSTPQPPQPSTYRLTTSVMGSGTVARIPDNATYSSGATVTLTATPANGYTFAGWTGDATGATNPLTVTLTANKAVTAVFVVLGAEYTFQPYAAPEITTAETYQDNPSLVIRDDWPGVARNVTNGYLALRMGPTPSSTLTDAIINDNLSRINNDLKYVVEQLRLPKHPSMRAQYINYYLLDSGLPGDTTAHNTETGYQGWREYPIASGNWYPNVSTTHHAMTLTDDYHRWSLTHEFIHVLQQASGAFSNDYGGWFHEAHDNFLGAKLRLGLTQQRVMGWLDPYALMGSYLPIESFGMKSDGSATGPGESATFNGSYGGYRYSSVFPFFLSQRVGTFFTNYLWQNSAPNEPVLAAIARILGPDETKRVLVEYGARNVILDYADWSDALKQQVDERWNDPAGNWFYTSVSSQGNWLVPSDNARLPRHTGRNNIPINVGAGAQQSVVEFSPDATGSRGSVSELRAQLVYRAEDGSAVFSEPVASGICSLRLTSKPLGGIVVLVVTNVKLSGYQQPQVYGWDPAETFGYKFRIIGNGSPAAANVKYF